MIRTRVILTNIACVWASFSSIGSFAQASDSGPEEFFEKQVRPVLVKRCYECHSGEKTKGGLALDTRAGWQKGGDSGPAIVPNKPDESLLIDAINYRNIEMPPKSKGGKLTNAEIEVLTQWVRIGAPDSRIQNQKLGGMALDDAKSWWAFQPLPQSIPNPSSGMIDEFIDMQLANQKMVANPAADKRTLIRRATYDLTGLPPTPAEVDSFLADDTANAFAALIDRLLASPQYGVKWGRHWLDVVRYADTAGENTDRPLPHAWRYRNWVIDAFNRDLPFDEFVRLQLAGDIIRANGTRDQLNEGLIATGYLAIARRFGHDIDKDIHLMYEDVIDNVGKNFLGLTTGCARCHDHKYDPITVSDYYSLYGIFDSSRFSFPGCEPKGQPRDLVPLLSPADVESLMAPWRERVTKAEEEKNRRKEIIVPTERLKDLASKSVHRLASAKINEGADVPILDENGHALDHVVAKKGEVFQLSISPNDNHGADTTLVEWTIREVGGTGQQWSLSDLVSSLPEGNPRTVLGNATWCFVEITNGPVFLQQQRNEINGIAALKSWSINDLPSVFVNSSDRAITTWTELPAHSFFVHPGPHRPVAIVWICPYDGEFRLSGRVVDAHPAGLDGVTYQLDHFTSAEFGNALAATGLANSWPILDPGAVPTYPVAYAVVEADAKNARIQQRGDHQILGEEVPRRWLSVFGGNLVESNSGSGRMQLGDWIASHPLMARVAVNRIWQGHFSHGLVRTPNDFGTRGDRPIRPELLDWLATQFVSSGYRVKVMHRLIMNTAAYQRNSSRSEALINKDPENRQCGRFERRRLTAEEIRDSLLFVAGTLDLQPGEAHPFPPESTWSFTQHTPFNAVYDTNVRSTYLMVQRQRRHPYLALFDGADTNSSTANRQTTTTPTQALYFMNDPFFHAQAGVFAESLLRDSDDPSRIMKAFHQLYQREPTASETVQAKQFLSDYPGTNGEKWSAYIRVLLAGNEFLYLD